MSFDLFVGGPYTVTTALPPVPAGFVTATAAATSGRYEANATLAPGNPTVPVRAVLAASLSVPGGCRTIAVTFKFSIGFNSFATVIPGPGYVSSFCALDLAAMRRTAGGITTPFFSRTVLAHTWVVITGVSSASAETARNPLVIIPLSSPTAAGEAWTFSLSAFAEVGGGGLFISAANARVSGTLYGFRVVGS